MNSVRTQTIEIDASLKGKIKPYMETIINVDYAQDDFNGTCTRTVD